MKTDFIEIGIISEVRADRARVKLGDMVTDFLPVFQAFSNSYAVSFSLFELASRFWYCLFVAV